MVCQWWVGVYPPGRLGTIKEHGQCQASLLSVILMCCSKALKWPAVQPRIARTHPLPKNSEIDLVLIRSIILQIYWQSTCFFYLSQLSFVHSPKISLPWHPLSLRCPLPTLIKLTNLGFVRCATQPSPKNKWIAKQFRVRKTQKRVTKCDRGSTAILGGTLIRVGPLLCRLHAFLDCLRANFWPV